MSCADKICHSMTTVQAPLGLIARGAEQLIGGDPQPVKNSRSKGYHDDIARNGLADSEHTNPEHVWGDEGPVND